MGPDPFARRLGSGDARTPGPDAGDPQRRQHARIRDRVQCGAVPAVLGSSQQATSAAAQPDHRAPGVRRGSGEARWTWHCWRTTSGTLAAAASWTSTRTCSANGSSGSVLRSMLASPLPPSRNSSSANRTALTRRSCSPSTAPAAICPAIATTCVGQALGVGAVLLAAGAEGKRSALPRAWVGLHQPAAQGQGPCPSSSGRPTRPSGSAPRSNVLTVDSGQRIDRLRAGTDHDRVLMARQAQQ